MARERFTIGTMFRAPYADGEGLFRILRALPNGVYSCGAPLGGPPKNFTHEQIRKALGRAEKKTKAPSSKAPSRGGASKAREKAGKQHDAVEALQAAAAAVSDAVERLEGCDEWGEAVDCEMAIDTLIKRLTRVLDAPAKSGTARKTTKRRGAEG